MAKKKDKYIEGTKTSVKFSGFGGGHVFPYAVPTEPVFRKKRLFR